MGVRAAWRASKRTTFDLSNCSSAVSSITITRSSIGRYAMSAFNGVVLPVLVPPAMRGDRCGGMRWGCVGMREKRGRGYFRWRFSVKTRINR